MYIKRFMIILMSINIIACSGADVKKMLPLNTNNTTTIPMKITIGEVQGSKKSEPFRFYLDDEKFRTVLHSSLLSGKIFSLVNESGNERYIMTAKSLDQGYSQTTEIFGFIFRMVAQYTLIDSQSNKTLYDETITSACKKTTADYIGGVDRVRGAHECAVKQNMQKLVDSLITNKSSISQ